MKLIAVLNAESGVTLPASKSCGLNGSPLQPLEQVGQQEAEDAEAEQRRRVMGPRCSTSSSNPMTL